MGRTLLCHRRSAILPLPARDGLGPRAALCADGRLGRRNPSYGRVFLFSRHGWSNYWLGRAGPGRAGAATVALHWRWIVGVARSARRFTAARLPPDLTRAHHAATFWWSMTSGSSACCAAISSAGFTVRWRMMAPGPAPRQTRCARPHLLDLMLPGMDGLDVAHELRRSSHVYHHGHCARRRDRPRPRRGWAVTMCSNPFRRAVLAACVPCFTAGGPLAGDEPLYRQGPDARRGPPRRLARRRPSS